MQAKETPVPTNNNSPNSSIMKHALIITSVFALHSGIVQAAKDVDLKPILASKGKSLFEGKFDSGKLETPWTMPKGDWQIKDGCIVGKEKTEDKHAAVLALGLPGRNSIFKFSFKLNAAKSLSLSFNHAKGHLFRVNVTPELITVNKDKDKKDETSKAEVLGKATVKVAAEEWHTLLVEIKGDKVAVQTDNGAKIETSNPALDVDKTGYRFVLKGEAVQIDDIAAWELAP